MFEGLVCDESDNNGEPCNDYTVRMCCEGCCSRLEVSGDPMLNDYYENYPGLYELTSFSFNGMPVYRQLVGEDELGNPLYGPGFIYYWGDIGWLLGANLFTYSYSSNGIGERCPQFAPEVWTNDWFQTSLNVSCVPVYPSCNDVVCRKNSYCLMFEDGPDCVCEDGYIKREDGSCSKTEFEEVISCGVCGNETDQWSEWLDTTNPSVVGEWETVNSMVRFKICDNPTGVEARRTDGSTDPLVTHIDPLYGFWCSNHEQDPGISCPNFEVRFCCPETQIGSDDVDQCEIANSGWAWSNWHNTDKPDDTGDWELISAFSDIDICAYPKAIKVQSQSGATQYTHLDLEKGFWCVNSENLPGGCDDYEVSYCCPAAKTDDNGDITIMEGTCDTENSYIWSDWLNSDNPSSGMGDLENSRNFPRHKVCQEFRH